MGTLGRAVLGGLSAAVALVLIWAFDATWLGAFLIAGAVAVIGFAVVAITHHGDPFYYWRSRN